MRLLGAEIGGVLDCAGGRFLTAEGTALSADGMKVEGHLTPSLAGKLAREANCRKLVLTHFYPPCNGVDIIARAKAEYPGEIVQAEDFMTIEIEG